MPSLYITMLTDENPYQTIGSVHSLEQLIRMEPLVSRMTDENRFCTACGARLPEGSIYCPECGRPVDGGQNPYAADPGWDRGMVQRRKSSIPVFLLLYGIFGLIVSLYMLSFAYGLNEEVYNQFLQNAEEMIGSDVSPMMPPWEDSLRTMMLAASVFGIISPVLALVSYYFCWKGGPWKNAIILCGLSSVLILGTCIASSMEGLILFLIGMFVTFMLYRDKDTFAS